jgi:uncharacterized protein YecE (DUF72 family)
LGTETHSVDPCGRDISLFVGVAGWSIGARYNEEMPLGASHLERYAKRLNAVEINSSFYRTHRTETYARWAGATPDGFRFSAKIPKTITHELRLETYGDELHAFADQVRGLGPKLAVVLVQLPPKLTFQPSVVGAFLADVAAAIPAAIAVEPRHPSWFAPGVDPWLGEHRVARVAADPAIATSGERPGGWAGLRYYRRHGSPKMYHSDYDQDTLRVLFTSLHDDVAADGATWCIFDNTASGAALGNALTILDLDRARRRASAPAGA